VYAGFFIGVPAKAVYKKYADLKSNTLIIFIDSILDKIIHSNQS
jgi:hypothetical protein